MPFNLAAASERTNQTIHAATVFHDQAAAIASACLEAASGEIVVAAVSDDHAWRGVWTVPRSDLGDLVARLDDGGWTLVFSPGTDLPDIEERCLKVARLAFARWEAARRWASAHREAVER